MDPVIAPLAELVRLQTRLFRNCLDGVDDEAARIRPGDRNNNMAFIAMHVVDARFWLAGYLGAEVVNPLEERLKDIESIEEMTPDAYPPLSFLLDAWDQATSALDGALEAAKAKTLSTTSSMPFPVDDGSMLGGLAFMLHHEAYHIGQLGLLRKHAGLDGMTYS